MLEIRYSAPYESDISGAVDELRAVRREILGFVKSGGARISFEADSSIDPTPYESALSKLVIEKGQGQTLVSLKSDKEVRVAGYSNCLEAFASFFDFEPDAGRGAHSHRQYYEGDEWIAADSIPLVIGVR